MSLYLLLGEDLSLCLSQWSQDGAVDSKLNIKPCLSDDRGGLSTVNLSLPLSPALFLFLSDDPSDLKAECSPNMDNEITAKERGVLEENNEKEEMDRETAQEEEEEEDQDEKMMKDEEGEGEEKNEQEVLTEEQELEELRAQVLQLLLELDDARETSNKHQESFHELQGEVLHLLTEVISEHLHTKSSDAWDVYGLWIHNPSIILHFISIYLSNLTTIHSAP